MENLMEDDDEFRDLYMDILRPFSSTSTTTSAAATAAASVAPQLHQPPPAPSHIHRPMDLNLQSCDDGNTPFEAPPVIPSAQTLPPFKSLSPPAILSDAALDSIPSAVAAPEPMVLDSKQESKLENEVEFDIEEGAGAGIEDIGSNELIPGLTEAVHREDNDNIIQGSQAEANGERDDWDSDSEDDLHIVLNDNHHGPIAMEMGGMMGDDDEDGDPLVMGTIRVILSLRSVC